MFFLQKIKKSACFQRKFLEKADIFRKNQRFFSFSFRTEIIVFSLRKIFGNRIDSLTITMEPFDMKTKFSIFESHDWLEFFDF